MARDKPQKRKLYSYYIACLIMTLSKFHAKSNLRQIWIIKFSETVVYEIIRNHICIIVF